MDNWAALKDLTGLGLAGLALLVLALTIRAIVLRKPTEQPDHLGTLQTRIDDLESRINRKDEDLDDEFKRCWHEINRLREFRHSQASNGTMLNLLADRVRGLEGRERV